MTLPVHARLIPGAPPAALEDVIFRAPFLEVARDAALVRLPDGTRLHWSRALGGVQHDLTADEQALKPILHQTVFAIVAWLDGLVPLPCPGLVCGDEMFIFHAIETDHAMALTALLAQRLGQGARVTDTMVALATDGSARLSGSAASARQTLVQNWLPEIMGTPTRPGAARVWLTLTPAPASSQPKAVTVISTVWGDGATHQATPQDAAGCAAFLARNLMLPGLGLALHGEAGLRDRLDRIGAALTVMLIEGDRLGSKPDALADFLARGMQAA